MGHLDLNTIGFTLADGRPLALKARGLRVGGEHSRPPPAFPQE